MNRPIRILQVVTDMNRGGLETMLMNYYRRIDRSMVQFDFLTHREKRAAYDDEIEALGGVIHRLPRLVPWSRSYQKTLDAFFATHPEYRIVHVHQDCLSAVILKAAEKHGVPVRIAHSHNNNQDKNLKYPIKLFYRRQIPGHATALFACGREAGEWMFRGAPFQILNNAIDTTQYRHSPELAAQMREALSIPQNALVIGHVGRFSLQKNHHFLIDIFAELKKQNRNAVLLLVGDGGLRSEIEEKIRQLGLGDIVIFTGIRSDVPALMQAMDVFVFPSLHEGLPVTLVEAQAAGLPCFVSDGVPDDCHLTDLVHTVSLREPPKKWAETILAADITTRKDTQPALLQAGFDIAQNARWLQEYYLEQWKANA